MKKICYIISQLGKGGAERQLYELLRGINRRQFDPMVITLSPGGFWKGDIERLTIRVIELERKKHIEFTRLFNLVALLKKVKPDIVHTYLSDANTYGRMAAILAGVPVIVASERNAAQPGADKSAFQMSIDRLLARFSDGIICNSQNCYRTLRREYAFDPDKIIAIENGIDITQFSKRVGASGQEKLAQTVIGTIGRLYPQKNHRLFLDAARQILTRFCDGDLKFLIIGNGILENELKDYSKKIGIEHHVIFAGERNDIPALLQGMDIFCLTSLYEGMSNAIMEAMLAGLPVVATDVGGNRELVADGETGFLCRRSDTRDLSEKMIYLLRNRNVAQRMGENGRTRITSLFGIEKMIEKTESIYAQLLN